MQGHWQQTDTVPSASEGQDGFTLGSRVKHDKFGEGIIINLEGKGEHTRVQVNFESVGIKWLVLSFARITRV
jgi:DNA helicase-2/ATP-dependent DNA helicase PcrA